VAADLALLGYFKYANFFLASANQLLGLSRPTLGIVLPLGISFFTFTQIAFLVDAYRGAAREYSFVHYLMFVTYFPHLIAGPLFHHAQMMPQFVSRETYRVDLENVGAGISIFVLGLAKKVLIADGLAEYASPVFDAVRDGKVLMFAEAWLGALAYSLQLYFDFSGYSDMAVGLALMFNVRLPLNFDSPYQAASIIEFWRRWHMTLSAFLRDYLYIPLGGNRKGKARRYVNLLTTMLLGGLWHGAGWTFVVWGGLHGAYLVINHAWRACKRSWGWGEGGRIAMYAGTGLTFLAVAIGWVFFRADSLSSAWALLSAMTGRNGFSLPAGLEARFGEPAASLSGTTLVFDGLTPVTGISGGSAALGIAFGLALCWCFPNVRRIMSDFRPVWEDLDGGAARRPSARRPKGRFLEWRLSLRHAIVTGALLFLSLLLLSSRQSEFLYFQF
jgi:D-alanyl-lipoteichoic acid acyltransferase DltB (MBOAT superfamily)